MKDLLITNTEKTPKVIVKYSVTFKKPDFENKDWKCLNYLFFTFLSYLLSKHPNLFHILGIHVAMAFVKNKGWESTEIEFDLKEAMYLINSKKSIEMGGNIALTFVEGLIID